MTYRENLTEGAEEVAEATLVRPVADDKTYEPPVDTGDPNQPTRPDPGDANGPDLDGGEANDLLIGGDGADVLRSLETGGLDVVIAATTTEPLGPNGGDLIVGAEGDEPQAGNRGNDIVLGEEVSDLLIVNNGDGEDFLEASDTSASKPTFGGSGNDVLIGDEGRDITLANDGNDFVLGQEGTDLLIVNNGDGSDFLENAAIDINILSGNDPNPTDGANETPGQEGGDLLIVNNGDGTDFLEESEGQSYGGPYGGSGNDVLLGDKGHDRTASADDLLDQPEAPGDPNEPTRPDPGDGENETPGQEGSDLLIVNNGDGSDFLEDSDAARYDPYKAFKFQVQTGEATEPADQIIFRTEEDDAGSASEAYFVKADAETTTQSGDDEAEDQIVVDYSAATDFHPEEGEAVSGFTPLIAFAPDVETPLDLGGADAMMSFDDIM